MTRTLTKEVTAMEKTDVASIVTHHTFTPWKFKGGTCVIAAPSAWGKPTRWNAAAAWWCNSCRSHCFELNGHCRGCGKSCRRPTTAERPRVVCAPPVEAEDWVGEMVDATGDDLWWCGPCRTAATRPMILAAGSRASTVDGCPDCGADRRPYAMADARRRLSALIDATPHLDWQISAAPK